MRILNFGLMALLCAASFTGYANAPDADRFAPNVASWFTGGGSGNFLAYTNNFGFTGTSLAKR